MSVHKKFQPIRSSRLAGYREHIYKCLVLSYRILYFDFFRLQNEAEAGVLGLEDYFRSDTICMVEWPEKAQSQLPLPDYIIEFSYPEFSLSPEASTYRHLGLYAMNERAYQLCSQP